jgi:hypothetical protein
MKTEQRTVFICEYCQKKMFGKGAMVRHEKYCKKNPNNQHKCFQWCKHLEMEKIREVDEMGMYNRTWFTCKAKQNQAMYSYKFEKNTSKPKDELNGLERMPLECEHFKSQNHE